MTAIYGIWRTDGTSLESDFQRLSGALAPYGSRLPIAWGNGEVALGKRLCPTVPEDRFPDSLSAGPLSPAPLSPTPLSSDALPGGSFAAEAPAWDRHDSVHSRLASRRWIVSADVRLTERDDLAGQLGLTVQAATMSDAALVAAAIECWGEAAFDRIYGPFAIAAWDRTEQRLLLARDYLGERPLFTHVGPAGIAFASMPEGLRALPDVPRSIDEANYAHFLRFLMLPADRTVFTDIGQVPQGHYCVVDKAGMQTVRYWHPDLTPLKLDRQEDYEALLAAQLDKSVAASLRGADGVLGAELSSGFDSTAVVSTAARQLAGQGRRIVAFTAVPGEGLLQPTGPEAIVDESELSQLTVAMHPNVELVRVAPGDGALRSIDRIRMLQPTPALNLCNLRWVDAIQREANRRGIAVMLHGSMGNGSLSEDGVLALPDLFRQRRFLTWFRTAKAIVGSGFMRWRGVLWNTLSQYAPEWAWVRMETATGRKPYSMRRFSLLRRDAYEHASAQVGTPTTAAPTLLSGDEYMRDASLDSVGTRLSYVFAQNGTQHHKATLAEWGIDMRDPTADRRLYELALRIPVERLIWQGEPRAILRKVLADKAPAQVLNTRRRGYQSADWAQGLVRDRAAIIDEVERIGMFEPARRLIDMDRLNALIAQMPPDGSDDWFTDDAQVDFRFALLRTISAASHMRHAVGSNY